MNLGLTSGGGAITYVSVPFSQSDAELFGASHSDLLLSPFDTFAGFADYGASLKVTFSPALNANPLSILVNSDGSYSLGLDPPVFEPVIDVAPDGLNGDVVSLSVENGDAMFNMTIGGGGTAELGSSFTVASTKTEITFSPGGGILKLDDPWSFNGTIYGAITGDFVDFVGVKSAEIMQFASDSDPEFKIKDASTDQVATIQFAPDEDYSGAGFAVGNLTGNGDLEIEVVRAAACFVKGTYVTTTSGEVLVENLAIADKVMTLHGGSKSIKWIGRRTYSGRFISGEVLMLPVCIKKNAIDRNIPRADLWVSPGHAIYINGELVPAGLLVNGISIVQAEEVESVTYIHIELDEHEVIFADGCPTESFIDDNCRSQFQNAEEFHMLYPNDELTRSFPCVPRVESGFALQAIQQRIAAMAGILPVEPKYGPMRGFVDVNGPELVAGWVQDESQPEVPVCLDIVIDGRRVERVLANSYRADLRKAGLGSGRHSFSFTLPTAVKGAVEVRRSYDRAPLPLTDVAQAAAA